MLADRCQVAIKQEAVVGTAETLAAANVIMTTERPTWEPEPEIADRNILSASPSKRGFVIGSKLARINFSMFARGTTGAPVDPTNLPDWVIPFRGCGMTCVVSGSGPNEITTATPSNLASVVTDTLAVMCDGKEYKIHGAVGSLKFTWAVGAPQRFDFSFTGILNTPTDVALYSPTYPAVVEPPFLGATLSILGFTTAKVKTITVDLQNQIAIRPQPNTTGFLSAVITGRDPVGNMDVEEELAGTKNWFNEWLAATLGSISTGVFPSSGANYNQFSVTMPNVQYRKVAWADRDNVRTAPVDFALRANTDGGNDELSFVGT